MDFDTFQTLLHCKGDEQKKLWAEANAARHTHIGDKVHFRGIIEFSNLCEKNCFYCGIRRDNADVERFRMDIAEIEACLDFIEQAGYKNVVLQSGELTHPSAIEFVIQILDLIKTRYADWGITLSLGELPRNALKQLKDAGATRYLLRIETSVPELYATLHPSDHSWQRRHQVLADLKELGYQVGTGNMVGMPGQTDADLFADLQFFKNEGFHMFGLGPYVIHDETPLATAENKTAWETSKRDILDRTLNFLAILRLSIPKANIAAATALEAIHPLGRVWAMQAGANIFMPSVTPANYRKQYLLYRNKPCVDDDAGKCRDCSAGKVRRAGLVPGLNERGDSLLYAEKA